MIVIERRLCTGLTGLFYSSMSLNKLCKTMKENQYYNKAGSPFNKVSESNNGIYRGGPTTTKLPPGIIVVSSC